MNEVPAVTVLIPVRNEAKDIDRCIRAVLAQDLPPALLEVIVVDGGSTDATVEAASVALEEGDVSWRILRNENTTTPSNLNAGLAAARGEYVCRVDARSLIPMDYVRLCMEVLESDPEVVVVGGSQVAVARDTSAASTGIARALNNRFAMGGSRYRVGGRSGRADTVYLGAFRRADLQRVGGWDERFATNQDYELNRRLGRRGVVWFDHRLRVGYLPRRSMRALFEQYLRFGRWKVRYWHMTDDLPRLRQIAILGGAVVLVPLAGAGWWRSPNRPMWLLRAAVAGLGSLAVLDALGNRQPATARTRFRAYVATSLVTSGWLMGVAVEATALIWRPAVRFLRSSSNGGRP